jgi:hypothetical protein
MGTSVALEAAVGAAAAAAALADAVAVTADAAALVAAALLAAALVAAPAADEVLEPQADSASPMPRASAEMPTTRVERGKYREFIIVSLIPDGSGVTVDDGRGCLVAHFLSFRARPVRRRDGFAGVQLGQAGTRLDPDARCDPRRRG